MVVGGATLANEANFQPTLLFQHRSLVNQVAIKRPASKPYQTERVALCHRKTKNLDLFLAECVHDTPTVSIFRTSLGHSLEF